MNRTAASATPLTPSSREPLAQEVTGKLQAAIESGLWALDERIPSEQELMKELGVSRGTLREAIKALSHVGMLEVLRGDGTYVRATSEISGATQKLVLQHGSQHVLEVRLALDTQAAILAASHAKASDMATLRTLLEERRRAWEEGATDAWIDADWRFHWGVAQASGNPLLAELYGSFGDVFVQDLRRQSGNCDAGCPRAGHEELLAAIENGDAQAAYDTVAGNLGV